MFDRSDYLVFRSFEILFRGFALDRVIKDRADPASAEPIYRFRAFLYRLPAAELLENGFFDETLDRKAKRKCELCDTGE